MAEDAAVAAAGSRREGRERILGLLYEAETKGVDLDAVVESLPIGLTGYAAQIVEALGDRLDEIDDLIEHASHHWSVSRMPAVDRALLRLATFELAHRPDIPAGALISEAVDLASEYSTDSSSRFVNGVLARLAGELRPDEPSVGAD
jgi:N utilization substance protein B